MKINNTNTAEFLVIKFPDFKNSEEFKSFDNNDLKLPYIVMNGFAKYAMNLLDKNGEFDIQLKKIIDFINEEYNRSDSDPEILDLISIEIFENFAQDIKNLDFLRKYTVGKARHAVEMSLTFTGIDKPDTQIAPEAIEIIKNLENHR